MKNIWVDEKSCLLLGRKIYKAGDTLPAGLPKTKVEIFKKNKQAKCVFTENETSAAELESENEAAEREKKLSNMSKREKEEFLKAEMEADKNENK